MELGHMPDSGKESTRLLQELLKEGGEIPEQEDPKRDV